MCGRFTLRTPLTVLAAQFQAELSPLLPGFVPRYNVAPTQDVFAMRVPEPGAKRQLVQLHWGLIPSWAKDKKIASSTINARADTIATKPAFTHVGGGIVPPPGGDEIRGRWRLRHFRSAFKKRRCLVVADGYYEWLREGPMTSNADLCSCSSYFC